MSQNTTSTSKKKKLLASAVHVERIMGRHVVDDDSGGVIVDWPGVRLEFGGIKNTTSVGIRLQGNLAVFGFRLVVEDDDDPEVGRNAVEDDDDDDELVLVTTMSKQDFELYDNLNPDRTYKVSLWKRDDPANGGATIHGLLVDAPHGKCKKRRPEDDFNMFTERPNRRLLEFVGDSDTVGFGIRGEKSSFLYFVCCQMALMSTAHRLRKSTDVTQSWVHVTAEQLQADYTVVAWSGMGVQWSESNTIPNMLTAYSTMLPSTSSIDKTHVEPADVSFFGPPPSVVIVYLGQNDEMKTKDEVRLQKAYAMLLRRIREYRPAPIPVVILVPALDCQLSRVFDGPKANTALAARQNKLWKQAVQELGDSHIHVLEHKHEPDIQLNSEQDYAIGLHWNVTSNKKWADPLVPKLKRILNW
jgi:lysophospholipase L1-like esterase